MVKVKVLKDFHLGKFDKLKNIDRANVSKNSNGYLYIGDTFECSEDMAKYLMNDEGYKNPENKIFVSRIPLEVVPENISKTIATKNDTLEEIKPKRITRRRKSVAKK